MTDPILKDHPWIHAEAHEALEVALNALRKISLNHPCDLHDRIAFHAVKEIEHTLKGEPYEYAAR